MGGGEEITLVLQFALDCQVEFALHELRISYLFKIQWMNDRSCRNSSPCKSILQSRRLRSQSSTSM